MKKQLKNKYQLQPVPREQADWLHLKTLGDFMMSGTGAGISFLYRLAIHSVAGKHPTFPQCDASKHFGQMSLIYLLSQMDVCILPIQNYNTVLCILSNIACTASEKNYPELENNAIVVRKYMVLVRNIAYGSVMDDSADAIYLKTVKQNLLRHMSRRKNVSYEKSNETKNHNKIKQTFHRLKQKISSLFLTCKK